MQHSNNVDAYIDYFRNLAVRHSAIQHDPESEMKDSTRGKQKFARMSSREAMDAIRNAGSKFGTPCLLLELYETNTQGSNPMQVRLRPAASFTVLCKPSKSGFRYEQEAFSEAETIVYDLLSQIYQDVFPKGSSRCDTPFKTIDLASLNITPEGPLYDQLFGYYVSFDFEFQNHIDITKGPRDGAFL